MLEEQAGHEATLAAEKALNSQLARVRAALMQTNSELAQQQALSADLALQQLDLSDVPGAILSVSAFAWYLLLLDVMRVGAMLAAQPAHGKRHCSEMWSACLGEAALICPSTHIAPTS